MTSTEFIKKRIATNNANVSLQNDAEFNEIKFSEYINTYFEQSIRDEFNFTNSFHLLLPSTDRQRYIPITVTYDENAEFEYFTIECCVCDGTLMFMDELATKCINKIVTLQTVNTRKLTQAFQDDPFNYEVYYTVGNFVMCDEYGDFGTEEKPWMKSRFTVMLPIKFDIKEKQNETRI